MPVIKVYGVPKIPWWRFLERRTFQRSLADITLRLRGHVATILVLGDDQVSVFYPSDFLEDGLGEELVAEILLNETEERPKEIMQEITEGVVARLETLISLHVLRHCRMVEAMTVGFQPKRHGYTQTVFVQR